MLTIAVVFTAAFLSLDKKDIALVLLFSAGAVVLSAISGWPLRKGIGLGILVAVFCLYAIDSNRSGSTGQRVTSGTTQSTAHDQALAVESGCGHRIEAMSAAESFAKDRLKAPATARFPSNSDFRTEMLSCGTWRVTSYVDAQNSFGAAIRTYYVTVMNYSGGRWFVVSFDFM